MRLHYLQHVPFEGLGAISEWAVKKGFEIGVTNLYSGESLPSIEEIDWLFVMGGPMNIYEEAQHPWLKVEKAFICRAIREGKVVIGICLGAQLIADCLGAKVTPNQYKEIGWFPVSLRQDMFGLPKEFVPFHWHGDTFGTIEGGEAFARSEGCLNQAFSYDNGRVVGLQFHLEVTADSISALVENCGDELVEGPYIESRESMLTRDEYIAESNRLMCLLLDNIYKKNNRGK
ncbi:MAG: type 1 glutamine amidotransferase [Nitrospinae bacterium]|nr:type 1 glutamine amidotransferase [Nitrospinota bacterium]